MNFNEATAGRLSVPVPRTARWLFRLLERLHAGRLDLVLPGGQYIVFTGGAPGQHAELRLGDWGVIGAILKSGDIGFAETYLDGRWETPDLAALLELAAQNRPVLEKAIHGSWIGGLFYRLRHLLRRNTRQGARRNIHAHYDLGNQFYRAWLDDSMTYSSAIFAGRNSLTLSQAQAAKYDRILDRLGVSAGQEILEIGCGWGGFAERAAARGARVRGITISREQLAFAQRRFAEAGIGNLARAELCDYRDARGQYDFVVSIEMFEAVGESYWPAYFRTLRERLRPGGRALVQSIVIDDALFDGYRRGSDFIQQYVFPGGMLPSPSAFREQAAHAGLGVVDAYGFGLDYAETLLRWRERYNAVSAGLRPLGFDERFERLWNFYLAYCEAGFRAGSIDVVQWELARD
jgi:cyclopropane-fatty-acyl-phospholipid synthase